MKKINDEYCLTWDILGTIRIWDWHKSICRKVYSNQLNNICCLEVNSKGDKILSCS